MVFHFIEALCEGLRVGNAVGQHAASTLLILGSSGGAACDEAVVSQRMEGHRALFLSPVVHQRDLAVKAVCGLLRTYAKAAGVGPDGLQHDDDDVGIVADLFNVLSLPWQATSAVIFGGDDEEDMSEVNTIMRRDVVELLVMLLTEPTAVGEAGSMIPNQCLVALADMEDSGAATSQPPSPGDAGPATVVASAPFAAVHSAVSTHVRELDGKLMMYTLVVQSSRYAQYVASLGPGDAAILVLPMFQQLYGFQQLDRRHTKLLLAALLQLSETPPFLSGLHAVETDAPWYECLLAG